MREKRTSISWFNSLQEIAGNSANFSNGINYQDWSEGLTIFGIKINPETISRGFVAETEMGTLTICVEFESPLAENCLLKIVGFFGEQITLNPTNRLISTSYHVGVFG